MSLEIRRRLGDRAGEAALLSNLAIVAEQEGDYPTARQLNEQALELRRAVNDRWALGVSHTNLGMICLLQQHPDTARGHFTEALALNLQVGDPWMAAISRHNLANAERDLGNLAAATDEYLLALAAYRGFDDRWALAILFEDVAPAAVAAGLAETALLLAGAADALRDALGSPRSAVQSSALEDALAPAAAATGIGPREQGRLLDPREVHALISGLSASFAGQV
jgi:tetratricopeptide (TPR) repeat protein